MRWQVEKHEWNLGFTLVELLVVIAITAILLGLLLVPLVKGFQLTRQGQTQVEVQNTARLAMEQVVRELKRAAYIFDNYHRELNLWVYDGRGNKVAYKTRFGVIDMVLPAQGDPTAPSNDPTSALPLPPPGQTPEINRPLSPGRVMVRYFIGLQDNESELVNGQWQPKRAYQNGFEARLIEATAQDNLYVLYRAEFVVYRENGQLNTDLFTDTNNDNIPDDFADPNFFYGPHWAGWRKVARPLVLLERADLVSLRYQDDGTIEELTPLFQIRPVVLRGQTASPLETQTLSEERGGSLVPTQLYLPHGAWIDNFRIVIYRSKPDADPNRGETLEYYYTERDQDGQWMLHHYRHPPNSNPEDVIVCNLSQFRANLFANQGQWWGRNGGFDMGVPDHEPLPFLVDRNSGLLDFTIPLWMFRAPLTFQTDEINDRFNAELRRDPYNAPNIRRYLTLLDLNGDGNLDDPLQDDNPLAYPSVSLVPNSEIVIGPDQIPGPNWGRPIRYTRVASNTQRVGPNQYRIRYTDLVDTSLLPRLRRGYIEFQSDPNLPLPDSRNNRNNPNTIEVYLSFQMNRSSDTIVADYITRQILNLTLSLKVYEPSTSQPQLYTLSTQVEEPNLLQIRWAQ